VPSRLLPRLEFRDRRPVTAPEIVPATVPVPLP